MPPAGIAIEQDKTDNLAKTRFRLHRDAHFVARICDGVTFRGDLTPGSPGAKPSLTARDAQLIPQFFFPAQRNTNRPRLR